MGGRAFVWFDGVMVDLNTLIAASAGVDLNGARAINNAGQIATWGTFEGDVVGLLLSPIETPLGNLTCDGWVLREDLMILIDSWGPCPQQGACPADLDGTGTVEVVSKPRDT